MVAVKVAFLRRGASRCGIMQVATGSANELPHKLMSPWNQGLCISDHFDVEIRQVISIGYAFVTSICHPDVVKYWPLATDASRVGQTLCRSLG